ncbi:hypothetical protein Fluta_3118 [Fluviicola taffensis DSM 16823]|uniref:Uncharacterized protein n=1 Tax=Fluviicola taffensis (strain DSM 16823 / NCIMB 13979 / RW262) TaxID=755732 RepID=F2IKG6_FLUTR|nr:hypothetical protein Fluta_3118 [Fluviicola taffensis DSM 16823]
MYTSEMIESLKKNDEFLNKVDYNELDALMSEFDHYEVESFSILSHLLVDHQCLDFDSTWFTHFEFFDEIERKSVRPTIDTNKRTLQEGPFSFL